MIRRLRTPALAAALLLSQSGCTLFGTGPTDARVFAARFDLQTVRHDRSYPSDPHSLEGYSIANASTISHPAVIGADFDARNDLYVLVRNGQHPGETSVFRFGLRGNPFGPRAMDYDIADETVEINDAIVTNSGTLLAAGRTARVDHPSNRSQIDFLVVGTATSGNRLTEFGGNGQIQIPFPAITSAGELPTCSVVRFALADPTGGFFAVGERSTDRGCRGRSASAFAIAKYTNIGVADSRFSGDGKAVVAPPGAVTVQLSSSALDADANLIIGGTATLRDGTRKMLIARILPNGSFDRTFGSGGWKSLGAPAGLQAIVRIAPIRTSLYVLMSNRQLRAMNRNGTAADTFGEALPGTAARSGQITVTGAPVSILATDDAFYVLVRRSRDTYVTKFHPNGDRAGESRVGVRWAAFPDSDFIGQELSTDGDFLFVTGLVQ